MKLEKIGILIMVQYYLEYSKNYLQKQIKMIKTYLDRIGQRELYKKKRYKVMHNIIIANIVLITD